MNALFSAEHLLNLYRFKKLQKRCLVSSVIIYRKESIFFCVAREEYISVHIYHSENYCILLYLFCKMWLIFVHILNIYISIQSLP